MYYERARPNPVNYVNNCVAKPNWQKHHILPCTSVKRSILDAEATRPNLHNAVKYFTKWNINKAGNLMPLPTRKSFQKAYGRKGGKQGVSGPAHATLPCHQPTSWGHTLYNVQVEKRLKSVWGKVSIKLEAHKLSANDVAQDLDDLIDEFKQKVETGRSGTLTNWRAMMQRTDPNAYKNFVMVKSMPSPI